MTYRLSSAYLVHCRRKVGRDLRALHERRVTCQVIPNLIRFDNISFGRSVCFKMLPAIANEFQKQTASCGLFSRNLKTTSARGDVIAALRLVTCPSTLPARVLLCLPAPIARQVGLASHRFSNCKMSASLGSETSGLDGPVFPEIFRSFIPKGLFVSTQMRPSGKQSASRRRINVHGSAMREVAVPEHDAAGGCGKFDWIRAAPSRNTCQPHPSISRKLPSTCSGFCRK